MAMAWKTFPTFGILFHVFLVQSCTESHAVVHNYSVRHLTRSKIHIPFPIPLVKYNTPKIMIIFS